MTIKEILFFSNVYPHIAENGNKVRTSGRNDKGDDIQVENDSSQPNDVVEIGAGQTNQPFGEKIDNNNIIKYVCALTSFS